MSGSGREAEPVTFAALDDGRQDADHSRRQARHEQPTDAAVTATEVFQTMPTSRRVITVVGAHAEGEIGDVISGGVLPPPGATMMEKKLAFERQFDHIRRVLIQEPRGSVARHVNLVLPSTRSDCAAGAIIMEPTEY